ncbi:MAG: hypothetical protein QOG91_464 [Candidatus Parcubacteria bacterium]|jgi:plastocyanin|nr:hypothetical protein [Candidatus Parcubacteria bacterium]
MNKNALITVIVIVVIIIVVIAVISYSNSQPTTPSTDQTQTASASPASDEAASDTATDTNSGSDTDGSSTDQATASSSATTTASTVDVSYGDNGFLPATITIKNGDSVRWTNNSSSRMWVASDPHPTHTDLPGFDELAGADPGQSWTYTFTVKGSHGYHNHARASNRGTVIVQ